MSRPKLSLPIQKVCFSVSPSSVVISPAWPGRKSRLAGSNSEGSTVPSHGASSATSNSNSNTSAPMRTDQLARTRDHTELCGTTVALSTDRAARSAGLQSVRGVMSVSDARIEHHVRQVDREVDQHVDEREQQDHALDGGKVARQHGID